VGPWALMGWALMAPPGPPWALMGWALKGPPMGPGFVLGGDEKWTPIDTILFNLHIYIYIYISIWVGVWVGLRFSVCCRCKFKNIHIRFPCENDCEAFYSSADKLTVLRVKGP